MKTVVLKRINGDLSTVPWERCQGARAVAFTLQKIPEEVPGVFISCVFGLKSTPVSLHSQYVSVNHCTLAFLSCVHKSPPRLF